MKIIVLGAGVVGVTSAYYLARDGHEVVVVDREGEAGLDEAVPDLGRDVRAEQRNSAESNEQGRRDNPEQ